MPKIPKRSKRVAIIYWNTSSVGGIATHLNALRQAAIDEGDSCDILRSWNHSSKSPEVFRKRKWIRGGDTKIWIDGELPHHPKNVKESIQFLKKNYDAIHFGFLCPHHTKAYPTPDFLPLFTDVDLPKTGTITDGYWDTYAEWGELCIPHLNYITTSGLNYANDLIEKGIKVDPLGMPFYPPKMNLRKPKSSTPLIIWPNQWKNIKGINHFISAIPRLPKDVDVELYSCGIRYYQMRTTDEWKSAVGKDHFKNYDGDGMAVYFGNVDKPEIDTAFQRAWMTVCLQGITARREAYKKGSYNNTELEALYFGAVPILHSSASNTDLPKEHFETVADGEEIPETVRNLIDSGKPINVNRQKRAREWVMDNYSAVSQYLKLRKHWS